MSQALNEQTTKMNHFTAIGIEVNKQIPKKRSESREKSQREDNQVLTCKSRLEKYARGGAPGDGGS
jgi:adenylate kinase family enzyme